MNSVLYELCKIVWNKFDGLLSYFDMKIDNTIYINIIEDVWIYLIIYFKKFSFNYRCIIYICLNIEN